MEDDDLKAALEQELGEAHSDRARTYLSPENRAEALRRVLPICAAREANEIKRADDWRTMSQRAEQERDEALNVHVLMNKQIDTAVNRAEQAEAALRELQERVAETVKWLADRRQISFLIRNSDVVDKLLAPPAPAAAKEEDDDPWKYGGDIRNRGE